MAGQKQKPLPQRTPPKAEAGRPLAADRQLAVQGQLAAIVIAVAMLLWIGVQWLGGKFGWDPRYAFLADLAAMAAFIWAMVVTFRIWRARRKNQG